MAAFAGSMIGLAPLKFAGVPWGLLLVMRCVHRRWEKRPGFAFRGLGAH
jgi:hypothetical protein